MSVEEHPIVKKIGLHKGMKVEVSFHGEIVDTNLFGQSWIGILDAEGMVHALWPEHIDQVLKIKLCLRHGHQEAGAAHCLACGDARRGQVQV
jgi:hypothetical protein